MNKLLILGGILKRIDNFNMNTFEGRLIVQKTVYFLQEFGLDFGYNFNFYLYGPYSPELTRDCYKIHENFDKIPKIEFINTIFEDKIKKLLDFLGDKKKDANWLELLASIHFLKKVFPQKTINEIIEVIIHKQTHFTKEDCLKCFEYLKRFEL